MDRFLRNIYMYVYEEIKFHKLSRHGLSQTEDYDLPIVVYLLC